MRFFDFEKKMLNYPVFSSKEVKNIFFDEPNILIQIAFWVKKGYVEKIKKGLYLLINAKRQINVISLAGKIYQPSYLSLEFALNYHGIIPDVPGTYTSVSTRKTAFFQNKFGNFQYRQIKKEYFNGYVPVEGNFSSFSIATAEKALFDYFYLNKKTLEAEENFWRQLRIDEEFKFNLEKIEFYKKLFKDKKISELADSLLAYQKNAG